jgi:NAD(P)-dependent dehydrogenase (short-subunit alcohol dehydrogenase family)
MTCRNDEKGQQLYKELCEKYPEDVERFFYQQLDITDETSIANLLEFIKKNFKKFDYLVNNAGYSSTGRDFNEEICEETFKVNYTGTVNFTEKMFGTINKNGKIIFVTAKSGSASKLKNENLIGKFKNAKNVDDIAKLGEKFKKSIAEEKTEAEGWYKNCFAISKLLLNYYAKLVIKKREISRESISVFAVHPGWCKTDMGGPHAPLEPAEGAERIMYLLELPDMVNKDFQGKFFDENKVTPID